MNAICAICGRPEGSGHQAQCYESVKPVITKLIESGNSSHMAICPVCGMRHVIEPLEDYIKGAVPYVICSETCEAKMKSDPDRNWWLPNQAVIKPELSSDDQCKYCTLIGDLKTCLETPCQQHRSWMVQELKQQNHQLNCKLQKLILVVEAALTNARI